MYKRNAQGWFKHLDFILWDVLCLQIAYILGYMIRHGWGLWPYTIRDYNSLAIVLAVVDILVCVLFNSMHNVMKRGLLRELRETVKHVVLVLLFMSLYLFSTQVGDVYSRITIYLTSVFHVVLGYGFRLLWKLLIRKINKNRVKNTMILVADEASIPKILKKADELDGFDYAGIVLSNRDAKGETIEGIKVVANLSDAADYICREWVDEVFVYPQHLSDMKMASYENVEHFIDDTYGTRNQGGFEKPADQSSVARLIEQCREMALPVHIRLPITSVGGKSFLEKVGGYNVLTMTANYASPVQIVLKRLFDVLGGIVGSIVALILIAIIGPKIKRESPGPILFKQTRIGKNGKKFISYSLQIVEKRLRNAISGIDSDRIGIKQTLGQPAFG